MLLSLPIYVHLMTADSDQFTIAFEHAFHMNLSHGFKFVVFIVPWHAAKGKLEVN